MKSSWMLKGTSGLLTPVVIAYTKSEARAYFKVFFDYPKRLPVGYQVVLETDD